MTREETFGLLAPLVRFRDEEEAIRAANNSEFGPAAISIPAISVSSLRVAGSPKPGNGRY